MSTNRVEESIMARCGGDLCEDIPRKGDGVHCYCTCGASARRDLAAQGVVIPEGHWVHVMGSVRS